MEGVSTEAISLAGHWGLGKLIALYDDNHISIDGHTDISFTEDVCARYAALGWHVQHVVNGNTDLKGIREAIAKAKTVTDKPSLIKARARRPPPAARRPPQPKPLGSSFFGRCAGDHADRLRLAQQGGQPRRARRAAGQGGGGGDPPKPGVAVRAV